MALKSFAFVSVLAAACCGCGGSSNGYGQYVAPGPAVSAPQNSAPVSLLDRLDQALLEQREKSAPYWVTAAKKNKQLGETAYAQQLEQAPKRKAEEWVEVRYHWNAGQISVDAAKIDPKSGTGEGNLWSRRATSLVRNGFQKNASPRMKVSGKVSGFGGQCIEGASWYETVRDCSEMADVYLGFTFQLRTDLASCPDNRGFHITAQWASGYLRKDASIEADICFNDDESMSALVAKIFERIDVEIRPVLPALGATTQLTPGYRYDVWRADIKRGGGHSHFGGLD